jgi:Uma2 family endonuclease
MTAPSTRSTAMRPAPPLANGDRLTREEFERRYEAMPDVRKAELIEGVVYLPSPVSTPDHSEPSGILTLWVGTYCVIHPEAQFGDNGTVRLDGDNEPQPDVFLRFRSGGTSELPEKYIEGPPELVAEVAATSASIDLHAKKNAYRRNGVREYIVWRTLDDELDWFVLEAGDYVRVEAGSDGLIHSRVFPGLALHVPSLLARDLAAILRAVS